MRKGGFLVRWFKTKDDTTLEGSMMKAGAGSASYRWRLGLPDEADGIAFGKVSNSVEADRSLTRAAKLFALKEIQESEMHEDKQAPQPTPKTGPFVATYTRLDDPTEIVQAMQWTDGMGSLSTLRAFVKGRLSIVDVCLEYGELTLAEGPEEKWEYYPEDPTRLKWTMSIGDWVILICNSSEWDVRTPEEFHARYVFGSTL